MEQNTLQLLGFGVLTWHSHERISDRYGSIHFIDIEPATEPPSVLFIKQIQELESKNSYGTLNAKVLYTRQSTHVGDWFRGFKPSIPKIDEDILIGTGFIFMETLEGISSVGLKPILPRASDWLMPKALYRCHHQSVALYFHPENIPSS